MSTRKRPRASLLPNPSSNIDIDIEEEDELSTPHPAKDIKKRRLNTQASSISTTKTSSLSKLGKKLGDAVGGLLERGKNSTEIDGQEGESDELGSEGFVDEEEEGENGMKGKRGKNPPKNGKRHVKNVFDPPSSGDEDVVMKTSKGLVAGRARRMVRDSVKVREARGNAPDLDEEVTRSGSKHSARVNKNTSVSAPGSGGTGSARRKGKVQLEQELDEEVEDEIAQVEEVIEELPKSSARSSARGKKRPHSVVQDSKDDTRKSIMSTNKERGKNTIMSSPVPNPQSSVKKRGRPRKNLDSLVEQANVQESPRGILTPSKGRGLKSKKSVAFEKGDNIDLGFKDIPTSAGSKKSRKSIEVVVEDVAVEGEEVKKKNADTACGVCLKTTFRKPNVMILCDGCDYGVHLRCCGLKAVPEGEWFCEKCQVAEDTPAEDVEVEEDMGVDEDEEDELAATTKPDIPIPAKTNETSCAICSGLDSKIGNKIILCDNCDMAVHVKCYNLPEFPKGDWYCRACLAAAGEDPFNLGIESELVPQPASEIPDIEGFEHHLQRVQRVVLDKLTGQRRIKVTGYDDEMQKVYQIVEQTVVAGEGNSMLLIGARGCGKTTLVESVISDISAEHSEKFHVVRLNGFIHTDDKIASKEIWRQLGREMELEDDGAGKPTNYADTLSTLLALLSHPSEQSSTHSPSQTTNSIVFILDEFDLFTTHSRQTLLYNLFDIAQARKAPIIVLGLTTRIDVVESLEKRVKSRFSHRYVHLGLPRSVAAFWEVCKQGLLVSEEELGEDDAVAGRAEFVEYWNEMVENLYTSNALFKNHLTTIFHRSKSTTQLFTSLIIPITTLSPTSFPLTPSHILGSTSNLTPPDSKLSILPSLSLLSLSLLICACRLDIILDSEICNFAMVYDEYSSLTSKHKIQTSASGVNALGGSAKVWGKEVAMMEWERLGEVGLLSLAGVGGGGGMKEAGKMGRMWRVDVGLEEIVGSVDVGSVLAKWCREI